MKFDIGPLASNHNRLAFSCGVDALDRYLHTQAGQDIRRRVSNCFVASPANDAASVAGFYTLAAASIPLTELPEGEVKRLPRYPVLPAVLVGRLAIDRRFQGQKLGAALILDAIQRAARADPAVFAMIVDAKDQAAVAFYQHLEFRPFVSRPMSLFLTMATAMKLLER